MLMHDIAEPVTANLEKILGSDDVPAKYREYGARLLDHLRRPVRIVVTGMPGTGKSALVNMMLSRPALGGENEPPIVDISHGANARVLFDIDNGEVHIVGGLLSEVEVPRGAVRARQELPIGALAWQTYRELKLSDRPSANARLLEAALKEADIVLWCTQGFDRVEQSLWACVPDVVKDHSFLVVTKADQQMMRGVLGQTLARLEPIVNEEFLGLYPVASIQAMTALTAGQAVDQRLWKSSGGKSLCDEIGHQVELGRSADVDQAQMLLAQFAGKMKLSGPGNTVHVPQAAVPARTEQQPDRAAPAKAPDRPEVSPEEIKSATSLLADAADSLSETGMALIDTLDAAGNEAEADRILALCAETLARLTRTLDKAPPATDEIRHAQASALEGEEMMMLFQLERGEDAAVDAVTLLLQLKKEMTSKETA